MAQKAVRLAMLHVFESNNHNLSMITFLRVPLE
jgi:hypothetical protein